jgi:hypothetical protein
MPVKDPGRIPVGLYQGEALSDEAVDRLSIGASRIIAFAEGDVAATITDQWARVAPGLPVEVVGGVSGIREAIIEAARRKVIWVCAPAPKNAGRFVAGALQGAAAATEFEIPSVAVHVLRDEIPAGPVAWLTQTGEMSGYGVLYAAAMAAMTGRSVTLIEPSAVRAPRTPEAAQAADRYIEQSGIEVERISDPAPLARVLSGSFGAVVHPVLDAPGGRSLLRPGELPGKSVSTGNAAAVVELIEKVSGDVIAVFDGVQLVYGGGAAAKVAASVALGVVALTGVGAAVAPGAMAAPPAGGGGSTGATGNTAVVQVEGAWYQAVQDVARNLHFTADAHHGSTTALHVRNDAGHAVTIEVIGYHGHGGSESTRQNPTINGHQSTTLTATGGTKHWGTAILTHIDGRPLPHPIPLLTDGRVVPIPPSAVTENPPQPKPIVAPPNPPEQKTPTPTPTAIPTPTVPEQQTPHLVPPNSPDQKAPGLQTTAKPEAPLQMAPPLAKPDTRKDDGDKQKTPPMPGLQVEPPSYKGETPTPVMVTPQVTGQETPQVVPQVTGQETPQVEPPSYKGETPTPVMVTPQVTGQETPMVAPPSVKQETPMVTPPSDPDQTTPQVEPPSYKGETPTPVMVTPQVTGQETPMVAPPSVKQEIPQVVTPTGTGTGTGTTTPDAGVTGQTPGGTTTPASQVTTPAGTVTPAVTPAQTVGTTTPAGTTNRAVTQQGQTTKQSASTHEGAQTPSASTAGAPGQLAHTGAGETGILAGLAAVLMAAGAGITAAARRNRDDFEGTSKDPST